MDNINSIKSYLIDDFAEYKTKTLLGSSSPTKLEKERIFKVLSYISNTLSPKITYGSFDNLIKNVDKFNLSLDQKYDLLKSKIEGCETNECLLLHAAMTYGLSPKSLLMDTIAIHSRIKKLDNKDAWFDNFSLNSFLLQLTTIIYDKYDTCSDKFIKSVPDPLNESSEISKTLSGGNIETVNYVDLRREIYKYDITFAENKTCKHSTLSGGNIISKVNSTVNLTHPKELLYHLGNEYRCFFEFDKLASEVRTDEEAIKMLDALAEKYVYNTGCTHGCDVFTPSFSSKSVSIADIKEFCSRYPMSIVGYILNTKTYRSGRGQHWVALIFKGSTAYLICSQSGGFNGLEEETLIPDLEKSGFAMIYNTQTIQHDPSSCGMYSVLSNLCFILHGNGKQEPNIKEIVNEIGNGGKNINKNGIYEIKEILAGYSN